jgi:RNA polymerase sigma-70 factor (sigma-E family)
MREPEGFRDYVAARSTALLRTAWLLTGDWFLAQDLVQDALTRTWLRWDRVQRRDAPDAYVRKVMLSIYLSWRRRRWNGEIAAASLPEMPDPADTYAAADLRQSLQRALAALGARQRAVVVLRFFDDLTETQVADTMGCSVGTVKSQSAKALARLRADPLLAATLTEEMTP